MATVILRNPDGSETCYADIGDLNSNTLLLLHGIGADHAMWRPQMQTYAQAGFHLLVPDLFGHGHSSQLNGSNLSSWQQQINWLLDHSGVETCIVIGVSMGGVIAQSFAVNYPQRVTKLIVIDSFGELRTVKERFLGFSQVLGFRIFKILGKQLLAKAICSTYRVSYAHVARLYFEKVCLTLDLNQMILARKAINQIDVLDQLSGVTIPALIMVGAELGLFFVEINRKIADALPNADFVVLERSMDPSNLVNPIDCDRQVLKFLGQS